MVMCSTWFPRELQIVPNSSRGSQTQSGSRPINQEMYYYYYYYSYYRPLGNQRCCTMPRGLPPLPPKPNALYMPLTGRPSTTLSRMQHRRKGKALKRHSQKQKSFRKWMIMKETKSLMPFKENHSVRANTSSKRANKETLSISQRRERQSPQSRKRLSITTLLATTSESLLYFAISQEQPILLQKYSQYYFSYSYSRQISLSACSTETPSKGFLDRQKTCSKEIFLNTQSFSFE